MKEPLSAHGLGAGNDGLGSKLFNLTSGMLLAGLGVVVRFVPAAGTWLAGLSPGFASFMVSWGWLLLMALAVGAFLGLRTRQSSFTCIKVYEDGIGVVFAGGVEVFAAFEECRIYYVSKNNGGYVGIRSQSFPSKVQFDSSELSGFDEFEKNVGKYLVREG